MSTLRDCDRFVQVLDLAAVLADSGSFVNSSEIAGTLLSLGYDVSPLTDAEIAVGIDKRCVSALLQSPLLHDAWSEEFASGD